MCTMNKMNTNRNSSSNTRRIKGLALANYHNTFMRDIQAGNVVLAPGRNANPSFSVELDAHIGVVTAIPPNIGIAGSTESSGPSGPPLSRWAPPPCASSSSGAGPRRTSS